jgi:hypothetical protein
MQDLCKNECQKEELKSVEIWKRKQSWLERYEEEYDSRNIFRKGGNTLAEYNNRGYNYNQNTRRRKNKTQINENYIEPENHSASNRFTRRQNNSQLQSQNKNYRRQDGFNQNNREFKSKNKYSVNQTYTRQQNVVHRNGTTYIRKNIPNHFLEQRVSDRAGGTPENNIQNANQEHSQPVQTKSHPETEETLVKEI